MEHLIDVVIPTQFRRQKSLKNLLFFLAQRNIGIYLLYEDVLSVPDALKIHESVNYIVTKNPSAARKRNEGLGIVADKSAAAWLIFLDDDFKLDDEFDKFIASLSELDSSYLGAATNFNYGGTNQNNHRQKKFNACLSKLSKVLAARLRIYPSNPMSVSSSGWHRSGLELNCECDAEWLHSGLLAVRLPTIKQLDFVRFPLFDKGSYLEDLWFTYHLSKYGRLRFFGQYSFETTYEEKSSVYFGFEEVKNRYDFVRFFNLSIYRFGLMLALRVVQNLLTGILWFRPAFLYRFLGNLNGIIYILR